MKKLASELSIISKGMIPCDDASRIARRTAEVHAMFKDALEHIYKDKAWYVLEHVNAVYIKREKRLNGVVDQRMLGGDTGGEAGADTYKALYVYMDDGNFRSDVHSQQHFILLLLKERYGEDIEVFKTFPSRMGMKERHPFAQPDQSAAKVRKPSRAVLLNEEEMRDVRSLAQKIDDEMLRSRFIKAVVADKEWKKGE